MRRASISGKIITKPALRRYDNEVVLAAREEYQELYANSVRNSRKKQCGQEAGGLYNLVTERQMTPEELLTSCVARSGRQGDEGIAPVSSCLSKMT